MHGSRAASHIDGGNTMTPPKPCALIALGAFALALANWTQAAGVFLPVSDADAPDKVATIGQKTTASRPNGQTWERRVEIVGNELARARDDVENLGTGRLLLNVRTGVELDMVVERTAPTRWGYSLSGRIEGGTVGFVTLVVHEQAVAGSIWTPDASYELVHLGDRVHALRDVTNEPPAECAGALPWEAAASDDTTQRGADDGSVVDILVVWTPQAEEAAGGESQVKSRIDFSIAFTNDAFERSGALVSLNLVGAEKVDYEEATENGIDLDRLAGSDDGHMDHIHPLRDSLGADLVHLRTNSSGGIAYLGGAFSINAFAHEIGHNMGIEHHRSEVTSPGLSHKSAFTVSNGARCESSLMAYGSLCVFLSTTFGHGGFHAYSSPWRYYPDNGQPFGVSRFSNERGPYGPADAVLGINRTRHTIANFRPSRQRAD